MADTQLHIAHICVLLHAWVRPVVKSGVISRAGLLAQGWTDKQIQAAVDAGTLHRVARGWLALPTAESDVVGAVRYGGRLGCLSGCRAHGLWTPMHREPHIIVGKNTTPLPPSWHRTRERLPEEAIYPLAGCLAQVIRHHSAQDALIVLESAANQGKITSSQAQLLIAEATVAQRRVLKFFNPRAESGSETKVRLALQRHRIPVRAQAHIPGVGWVDHLVGRRLIIECDSKEFHAYSEEDYRRDMAARDLGYDPVRLSYRQIHYEWESTWISLQRSLRTGQHLKPPKAP